MALLFFLMVAQISMSAEFRLPKGCQALKVQGSSVSVQSKKNSLFFIHNLTPIDLWITHQVVDPDVSAGLSSHLQSKNWSALSLGTGSFVLNCIESRPGHEQEVPCEGAITVCKLKKVKFPQQIKGTVWAPENMSLSGLTAAVGTLGYVLPN